MKIDGFTTEQIKETAKCIKHDYEHGGNGIKNIAAMYALSIRNVVDLLNYRRKHRYHFEIDGVKYL